jgi:hypothetical protein
MKLPDADQSDFASTIGSVLTKRDTLEPLRHSVGARTLDRATWDDLVAAGVLEPAEAGDLVTACLVAEEMGRRAAPLPYLSAAVAGALVTAAGGSPNGTITVGLLDAMGAWETTLEVSDGSATGVLPFVPDADAADAVVVRVAGTDRLAIVRTADTEVAALESLDGTQPLFRVSLDGVPAEVLPDEVDLDAVRDTAIALHCASLLGSMSWLLETTAHYTGQRVQFGMPIASRQAVKQRCASMLIEVESTRAMVLELADTIEQAARDRGLVAATTMAWTAEAAESVAAGALQLHGGIGFTWEHDLHHYFKRCTVGAQLLGTAAAHRTRVVALLRASA